MAMTCDLPCCSYCLLFPGIGGPTGLAGSCLPPRPQLLIDPYDKGNLLGAREVAVSLLFGH